MTQWVECVPNFSEGRNRAIIDAIAAAIESVPGVTLLDVDPGEGTNRTVVTFVASPEAVEEAAFRAIQKAAQLIDMRKHHGAHPRQGATDVCPFVPLSGVTVEECVELAHRLGRRVGEQLGIPVYLYESAATHPARKSLADIRAGEYEALAEKLRRPEWQPDYGPAEFNAGAGATVIGVRPFLIAYNINLNTRDDRIAKAIGCIIREKGYVQRDDEGKKVRTPEGDLQRIPGLPHCRATGWFIEEYGRAQVTMNLTNFRVTPIHVVFDHVEELAIRMGARVTGSEIVGLVPKEALLMAGRHYMRKQGKTAGVSERELCDTAVLSLGLNDVAPFDVQQKVIEYRVASPGKLRSMNLHTFVDEVGRDSPAPGGGSVSALAGALAAGLTSMVAALTHSKKGYIEHNALMEDIGIQAQTLKEAHLAAVDTDSEAFQRVMASLRLPKATPEQKAARQQAIEEANSAATLVPLTILESCSKLLELIAQVVEKGYQNSISDAGVACLMARAAAYGAYYNVLINLRGSENLAWKEQTRHRADGALVTVDVLVEAIQQQVLGNLKR